MSTVDMTSQNNRMKAEPVLPVSLSKSHTSWSGN